MLKLYIANKNYSSWSLRPWILLQELGIAFDEVLVPFGVGDDPLGFKAFSPTGKVPCLVDGATVVWDSLAITEYLAESHPTVWPADATARAWARCAAAEMHSGFANIRNTCTMNCGIRVALHNLPPQVAAELARVDELWREGLARFGGPFLAGSTFTAADAFYAPVAFRAQTYGIALSREAESYRDRLLALRGMQHWYADALQETWRDEEHEAEARLVGRWIEDFRKV